MPAVTFWLVGRAAIVCLLLCPLTHCQGPSRLVAVNEVQDALASTSATLAAFANYKVKYSRSYLVGTSEHFARLANFNRSLHAIAAINDRAASFYAAVGPFADYSPIEYKQLLGLQPRPVRPDIQTQDLSASPTPPTVVNWVTAGKVSPVKNQGHCGSCWSFSTTGSVETLNAIRTGTLVSLSEQQLVSCDTSNNGCDGGFMDTAWEYIQTNNGATEESIYPYASGNGRDPTCDGPLEDATFVTINGFNYIAQNSEAALAKATAVQAVSVGIAASTGSFQHYGGGIYDDFSGCGTSIDHAVLVVGYNQTEGSWLVKNSWGPEWGEAGYIRMAMGNSGTGGQPASGICAILSTPMVPLKNVQNPPFPGYGAPGGALPPFPPQPPGGAEALRSVLWRVVVLGMAVLMMARLLA